MASGENEDRAVKLANEAVAAVGQGQAEVHPMLHPATCNHLTVW